MKAITITATLGGLVHMAAAQASRASNCTIFNWNKQPAYLVNDTRATRVSGAQTCPQLANSSHACPILVSGDAQILYRANLTNNVLGNVVSNGPNGIMNYYVDLVNRTIGNAANTSTRAPFRDSVVGVVDAVRQQPAGTSGYVNFYATLQCYEGTLSNCSANTLPDDTAVQFCAPVYHTTRQEGANIPILDGTYVYQEVDAANVSQYPNPFGGQSRGAATSTRVSMGLGLLLSAVVAAMMMS